MSNQQVRMMRAKFVWPWEVLVLDTSELDQEPESQKVSSSGGRHNQHNLFEHPLLLGGDLVHVI